MMYYLFSSGKIPGLSIQTGNHKETIKYILPKVKDINDSYSWDDISVAIVGTQDRKIPPLHFNISVKGKKYPIQTLDYPGEIVEFDNEDKEIEEFLTNCDAIMLFLGLEEALTTDEKYYRQNEFINFLGQIAEKLQRNHLDIPVVLVVTKYDLVENRPATIERLTDLHLKKEYNQLSEYCKKFDVLAISSKECFEYYHTSDNDDETLPDCRSETIDAKNISAPILLLLDRFKKKQHKKNMKPVKATAAAFLWLIILLYSGLYGYVRYEIHQLDRLADSHEIDNYTAYEMYYDFYRENAILQLFPMTKADVGRKAFRSLDISEDEHFGQIKDNFQEFNNIISEMRTHYNSYIKIRNNLSSNLDIDRERRVAADLLPIYKQVVPLDEKRVELYDQQQALAFKYDEMFIRGAEHKSHIEKMNELMKLETKKMDKIKEDLQEDVAYFEIVMIGSSSSYQEVIERCNDYIRRYPNGKYVSRIRKIETMIDKRLASKRYSGSRGGSGGCLGSGMLVFVMITALVFSSRKIFHRPRLSKPGATKSS